MPATRNRFLEKMLERLYASLSSGPALNCRPHQSRQRVDLALVASLDGSKPEAILARLLAGDGAVKLTPRAPTKTATRSVTTREAPASATSPETTSPETTSAEPAESSETTTLTREEREAAALLGKLRNVADDARTFEQDTGAHVLHVGFPLLQLPPGNKSTPARGSQKRVLAPIAFVPVSIKITTGRTPSVVLEATGGLDRVLPNTALLAWLAQQTGERQKDPAPDEEGKETRDPWVVLSELVAHVSTALALTSPVLGADQPLAPVPRADDEAAQKAAILPSAVIGLYPLSNQALLLDVEDMLEGKIALAGPIESFLRADASLAGPGKTNAPGARSSLAGASTSPPVGTTPATRTTTPPTGARVFAEERCVTEADPCQARAVRLARQARGLVVHGPPGTGKSQTIANIVGDHLARGERVLFVCDKRTALDVVFQRVSHLGLGQLCAVVHDAHRDQRELYRSVRDQLDGLVEAKTNPQAAAELEATDRELTRLHEELTRAERALAERPSGGREPSYHELAGRWLELELASETTPATTGAASPTPTTATEDLGAPLDEPTLAALPAHERAVREVLERSQREGFPTNPWRELGAAELPAFLARPLADWKTQTSAVVEAARAADATIDSRIPPFTGSDLLAQGVARAKLGRELAPLASALPDEALGRWAKASPTERKMMKEALKKLSGERDVLARGPLDPSLAPLHDAAKTPLSQVTLEVTRLKEYLESSKAWYGFLAFGKKSAASPILARFGLTLAPAEAERVLALLEGIRARAVLADFHKKLAGTATPAEEGALGKALADFAELFVLLERVALDPILAALEIADALGDRTRRAALVEGLALSEPRAQALARLEGAIVAGPLAATLRAVAGRGRANESVLPGASDLDARLGTVEGVLRLKTALATLPAALATRVVALSTSGLSTGGLSTGGLPTSAAIPSQERDVSSDAGWTRVHKAVVLGEMARRVRTTPALAAIDSQGLKTAVDRFRALERRKLTLVRDVVRDQWTRKQQERLLASTGSRLGSEGAELKRRLMLRGERALKLRPMIAAGARVEGGDPLFLARPVWMASPQTVAQVFPREALFDVVIFDEASQLRLEEALPVLLRAKRLVVAGDPKQLPPTRFFESAVVGSQDDSDTTTEQGLFEEQQSEVEDLLGAALNLEVEPCYLDVHYRSRNSDLIDFSNKSFYESRLQPIPGHPSRRAVLPPIRLVAANGVYEKRVNLREAESVVAIVRDLLGRGTPPSIGIACMNLTQKDAIQEALEAAAAQDATFAGRLAAARAREGAGSFEGLFVKNLENVQGDERDHMIVSTTYGPDARGRFYRRFGPLGSAGGGRRLNVLVTRARDEVHLVTSIPPEQYRALAPIEAGKHPNGAWLLFEYLRQAEALAALYLRESERLQLAQVSPEARVLERPTSTSSLFARALGRKLKAHGVSSEVHWGNEGFMVDLALAHPTRAEDVTIGVLVDGARFERTQDKVEWDLFRSRVLEGQGWKLHRVWSPQFVRDPAGSLAAILESARAAATENSPTSERTPPT